MPSSRFYTMLLRGLLFSFLVSIVVCLNVTFDNRAFLLDGERTLFVGGSIHYPRAQSAEWPNLIKQAKDNGINLIQTYVFWDIHEPKEGEYYFPSDGSSDDVVAFIKECQAQGVYVNLRFGPYVCAEWNYGGFPVWLRGIKDITYRTMNDQFLEKMAQFVDATLAVVSDARLLASDGGPIVMLQIENEYGNMEHYYPKHGDDYVQWAANYANSKKLSVPWIMCQQGEGVGTAPPANVINTCNGYYCDNWISQHATDFPNQPHMWTENWPGWFQLWGEAVPHRPAVDVAFAVARWYARGGSFSNYYMAFGGTTFGRQVGGPLIITSYDYDVQINEYGLRAEPKFSLLAALHSALHSVAPVLLSHDDIPPSVPLNAECDSILYDDSKYTSSVGCVAFLSNIGTENSCTFDISGVSVEVPPWSVSVVTNACYATAGSMKVLLNTKNSASAISPNKIATEEVADFKPSDFLMYQEPVPATHTAPVHSASPPDQLALTQDSSDYLWVSSALPARAVPGEAELSFLVGDAGGPVCYVYVDGVLAASTIETRLTKAQSSGSSGRTGVMGTEGTSLVADSTARASTRTYSTEADATGIKVRLTVNLPASNNTRLDILFASTGIKNYGPYLEKIRVGVTSDIYVDGTPLRGYSSVPGLNGEHKRTGRVLLPSTPVNLPFSSASMNSTTAQPLAWYKATFNTPAIASETTTALAIDISATQLVKGAMWINDFMLGRYWNILAGTSGGNCDDAAQCTSETYTGGYSAEKCRTGCGDLTQALYKLPPGVLYPVGSGKVNTVVFLEEAGGSPEGVKLQRVFMEDL